MKKFTKWLKKYFVPHKGNDHRPHLLRHKAFMVFLFLVVLCQIFLLFQVFIVFDKTNFLASVLPGVLTNITNQERKDNSLPPLTTSDLLTKAANLKAKDMATKGYFAHTSPEGKTPWYWFREVGYSYQKAGENLAVNFFESRDVAEAWMNSPTHKANIVKPEYTEIGIGVAEGIYQGRNTVFVAELFGMPIKINPIEIPIEKTPEITTIQNPKTNPTPKITPVAITPTQTAVLGEEVSIPIKTENISTLSRVKTIFQRISTSPLTYIEYVLGTIAILVLISLIFTIFTKREVKHSLLITRGFAIITIILLFVFLNIKVFHLETNIGQSDSTANAIDAVAY